VRVKGPRNNHYSSEAYLDRSLITKESEPMPRRRAAKTTKKPGAVTEFPNANEGTLPEMGPVVGDSYSNPAARLGVGTPNLAEAGYYPLIRLTEDYPLILSLYRSSWIIRRIVEAVPDDMLKSFPALNTEIKPDLIKRFEKIVRKTGTLKKIRQAAKWGRLFGGAGAVIVIAGHHDLAEPLDLEQVEPGSYKGLITLDRWSGIIPGPTLNDDIEDTVNFGLPANYNCIMDAGSTEIHHSRILRFIGRDLPQWEKQVELYWGESEVEVVFDELKKRDYSSWNIVSLLTRAQVMSIEEPQLAALMSGITGGPQAHQNFVTRMEAMSQLLNSQGLMVLGKDGKLNQNTYSFGGISDVYHEFMKDLAAACGIPYEILFGRESGLGSNGEGGLQIYYDMLEQKRTSDIDPVIDQLLPIIAMSAFGEVPDDLDHHWQPVRTMTEKERAELAKSTADSIAVYFNADLMTKREARMEIQQSSVATGIGSNLTDEAVAATPDKYASELGMGEMQGEQGEQGEQPGENDGEGTPDQDQHLEAGPQRPNLGAGKVENPFSREESKDDNPFSRANMKEPKARQHEMPVR
jgi:hypothetical protein